MLSGIPYKILALKTYTSALYPRRWLLFSIKTSPGELPAVQQYSHRKITEHGHRLLCILIELKAGAAWLSTGYTFIEVMAPPMHAGEQSTIYPAAFSRQWYVFPADRDRSTKSL